jgi:hypothetical protein
LRERTLNELNRLPDRLRGLKRAGEYRVVVSEAIHDLARQVDAAQQQAQAGREEQTSLAAPFVSHPTGGRS